MDLQIRVSSLGSGKELFRSTVVDVPESFEYDILVKAFKLVFPKSVVSFNIV